MQMVVQPSKDATGAQKMSKADGASLAEIVANWTVEDIEKQYVSHNLSNVCVRELIAHSAIPAIFNCGTACKVTFANRLVELMDDVEEDANADEPAGLTPRDLTRISKDVYTYIWETFEFEPLPPPLVTPAYMPPGRVAPVPPPIIRAPKPEDHLLSASDIALLLKHTVVPTHHWILERLHMEILRSADSETIKYTLIPFVKMVFEQEVDCLKWRLSRGKPPESTKELVTGDPRAVCRQIHGSGS